MPITRSAIKKLRKDKKKTGENSGFEKRLSQSMKKFQKTKSSETLSRAISLIDKATKKHLMHANKASRLKSKLSRLIQQTGVQKIKTSSSKKKSTEKTLPKKTTKKKSTRP